MIKQLPRNKKRLASGIAANIRREIASGNTNPGEALPTARELASAYRVSQVTANRALESLASEGVIYRVKGQGSFVADQEEQKKTYTIGLAIPSRVGGEEEVAVAFDVFPETIINHLHALGHQAKTLSKHDLVSPGSTAMDEVDGVIISPDMTGSNRIHQQLTASGKHVVLIRNTNYQDHPFHQVIADINPGFRQAVQLFQSLGHANIMVACCDGVQENVIRRDEFVRCAHWCGIPAKNIKTVAKERMVGDLGRNAGRQIGEEIIASGIKHPAVFSVGDFTSFGIVDALHAHGMEVGRDLDLISFDNLEGGGLYPFGEPILTSVTFPRERISQIAVDFLLNQIEESDDTLHVLRVPTSLVIRKSTAKGAGYETA